MKRKMISVTFLCMAAVVIALPCIQLNAKDNLAEKKGSYENEKNISSRELDSSNIKIVKETDSDFDFVTEDVTCEKESIINKEKMELSNTTILKISGNGEITTYGAHFFEDISLAPDESVKMGDANGFPLNFSTKTNVKLSFYIKTKADLSIGALDMDDNVTVGKLYKGVTPDVIQSFTFTLSANQDRYIFILNQSTGNRKLFDLRLDY